MCLAICQVVEGANVQDWCGVQRIRRPPLPRDCLAEGSWGVFRPEPLPRMPKGVPVADPAPNAPFEDTIPPGPPPGRFESLVRVFVA